MTTRRDILMRIGAVGGFAAAYAAASGLGLMGSDEAWAGTPDLQPDSGKGVRVVILGAGVAGMSAAYELGKAGYQCTVLEARDRVGGRNFTVRKGTVIEMNDGSRQVCQFDDGYYFNAGPARIPSNHQATLGYCKQFGVQMETEVNWSGSALIQTDRLNGGKALQMRQAVYDYRGHMAELFAKCVNTGALDDTFSKDDRDKLMTTMGNWGGLFGNAGGPPGSVATAALTNMAYKGSTSAGYATEPGAGDQVGTARAPLPLDIVGDPFVQAVANFTDIIEMQATMQQPVGGMDMIAKAFERELGDVVRKGCEVKRIKRVLGRKGAQTVEIQYWDKISGTAQAIQADYCICTIPLTVLSGIANDFSKAQQAAIARNKVYGDGYKIAFQSPRFWEDDQIYGGLSFTDRDTFITWYPSAGFHQPQGIIVAGYAFDGRMGTRDFAGQVDYAKGTIDRLHPGKSGLMIAPVAVQWSRMPYSGGLESDMAFENPADYTLLSQADGPFYFAGEHLSHVGAWQQGAFVSAHRVVNMIAARQQSLKA